MKRLLSLILVLIAFALTAFGVRHVIEKRSERRREIAYQSALRSYSERLKPGMTRKEVED